LFEDLTFKYKNENIRALIKNAIKFQKEGKIYSLCLIDTDGLNKQQCISYLQNIGFNDINPQAKNQLTVSLDKKKFNEREGKLIVKETHSLVDTLPEVILERALALALQNPYFRECFYGANPGALT